MNNTVINLPILSRKDINFITYNLLTKNMPDVLNKPKAVPVSLFIEKVLGLDLEFKRLSTDESVLGATVFSDGLIETYDARLNKSIIPVSRGTIIIDSSLIDVKRNEGRGNFTMAHEVGHWILHNDSFNSNIVCRDIGNRQVENWAEWQADEFASMFLMPEKSFIQVAKNFCDYKNISFTPMCSYPRKYKLAWSNKLIEYLAWFFKVSYSAAKIRALRLNILLKNA